MRGLLFDGHDLRLTGDLAVRPPGPGEVAVRIVASGICHSDLNVIDGTSPRQSPIILGHEGAGLVTATGPGASRFAPGDRVVIATVTPCRSCRACARGDVAQCPRAFGTGETPFTYRGAPVGRYANASTWASDVVVTENQLFDIGSLEFDQAALVGCAVSTGWGCVRNVAKVRNGDTIAVIGIGGIGANVIQTASLSGASRIVAIDVDPSRRDIAARLGATDVVIAQRDDDLVAAVRDVLGDGADHAFECAGLIPTIEAAIAMTAPGGQAILIGIPPTGARASFDVGAIFRGRAILGSLNGACDPAVDFPLILDAAAQGRLDLASLVSEVYPLAQWADAIAATRSGRVVRSVLDFTDL